MTDDASTEAAGNMAGGPDIPLPAVPPGSAEFQKRKSPDRKPSFAVRRVPRPTATELQARRAAMEHAIKFGAAPYRDSEGKARYVFFREANNAPVEAWQRDPKAKRGFRKTQQVRKAAGQLIWHPEDQIELAKRLGVIHYREGRSAEGAAERGLFDAIWRYEHVYDSFTVPRRYGLSIMETGRIAAVAEEEARKLQAEDPAAQGGFWVRDRKNLGLIYVVPNPDTKADDAVVPEAAQAASGDPQPAQETSSNSEAVSQQVLDYPDIPLKTEMRNTNERSELYGKKHEVPVINLSGKRRQVILDNEAAVFEISDSPNILGNKPWYAVHKAGYLAVLLYNDIIEFEAHRQGVDPVLVKAMVYTESANGALYGPGVQAVHLERSTLPMNIRSNLWSDLVGENSNLRDPLQNIEAGVRLLGRIVDRLRNPSVAKVATLYNSLAKEQVTELGARTAQVYKSRAWERVPGGITPRTKAAIERRRATLKARLGLN